MFVYTKRTDTRRRVCLQSRVDVFVCNYKHSHCAASPPGLQPRPRKQTNARRGPKRQPSVVWAPHGMFFRFYSFFLLLTTCFFFIFSFILIMTPPIPHNVRKPCVTAASLCSQGGNRSHSVQRGNNNGTTMLPHYAQCHIT